MASLRDIRQKIKSVTSTQQITNAMRMMSTARLSRSVEAVNQTKDYISKLLSLAGSIKAHISDFNHPALSDREVKQSTTIVIGGERGLCGGFNNDLQRFALNQIKQEDLSKQRIYAIGQKPIRFFETEKIPVTKAYYSLNMKELGPELITLAHELYNDFVEHRTDRITIIYTSYVSSTKHPIVCGQLLPIATDSDLFAKEDCHKDYDFYPSPQAIFDSILPRYMYNSLLKAVLESIAAEQCARMIAMTSATDRANEKLEELQLVYNRSRQAQITQELNEVIAGSQV